MPKYAYMQSDMQRANELLHYVYHNVVDVWSHITSLSYFGFDVTEETNL